MNSSTKTKLLHLMKNDNPHQAIEAVLDSGLLPEPQLRQWLDNLVERAIYRVLGRSGCPEWEVWASKWLSGEDSSEDAAWAAREALAAREAREALAARATRVALAALAAQEAWAARAARAAWAAWAAALAAEETGAAALAAEETGSEERKAQYDDLLNLINDL